jgi:hypothetical protein
MQEILQRVIPRRSRALSGLTSPEFLRAGHFQNRHKHRSLMKRTLIALVAAGFALAAGSSFAQAAPAEPTAAPAAKTPSKHKSSHKVSHKKSSKAHAA